MSLQGGTLKSLSFNWLPRQSELRSYSCLLHSLTEKQQSTLAFVDCSGRDAAGAGLIGYAFALAEHPAGVHILHYAL